MVRVILCIYVAMLLVSCSKNDSITSGEESGMVGVTISASIDDGSTVSRSISDAGLENFDNENQIGVFLCKTNGVTEANTGLLMYHTTSYYRNLMAEFTSQNNEWIFYVSYTGLLIVPSVYDNKSTLEGNLDCYAYSPYIRSVSGVYDDDIFDDITKVPLVNGRDVMWAVGYDPSDADDNTEVTEKSNQNIEVTEDEPLDITLKFKRAMTKINFEFSLENEQTGVTVDTIILATEGQEILISDATIDGRDGEMDMENIQYADTVKLASLLAIESDPDNSSTYEALLIPFNMEKVNTATTESGDVEVTLVINGQRTYNSLPLKAMELVRGNSYTMKIIIDNFLKISTSQGLQLNETWTGDEKEIII